MSRDSFGENSTTDEVLEGIDLSGKKVLITGGTSGLGEETARALSAHGADVIVTARKLDKAKEVAEKIKAATGKTIDIEQLELDSLASIRAFAKRFLDKHDQLDLLINNAGVMACPFGKTQDGFELQFGTNHIGHFLLTNLIISTLIKGAPSRIVNLSSRGHRRGPVVFEDINYAERDYEKWAAYGQSKTANILFTVELEKRLASKGVHSYALHPGAIPTELGRHLSKEDIQTMRKQAQERSGGTPMKIKTIPEGAATQCYAATAPELEGKGGVYLSDCQIESINDDPEGQDGLRSYAIDQSNAAKLWAVSEELVGETFNP